MQITRQADYAIRAVRHLSGRYAIDLKIAEDREKEKNDLAQKKNQTKSSIQQSIEKNSSHKLETLKIASTHEIATEQRIPASFLAKIISQLQIADLVQTSRGASGGVTLSRSPGEISLLEVVEAIDGPIYLNECVADNSKCSFEDDCPLKPIWCEAQEELVKKLRATKFDQFSNGIKH